MTLSTFGAIMGFALEMIKYSLDIYKTAAQKAQDPLLKETLLTLLREEEKNYNLMEQTRRENVTEMILEAITGLKRADYELDVKLSDTPKDPDLFKAAIILEEKEINFFNDSSVKIPFLEVSRIFRKIVQKKEKNLAKLKNLGLDRFLRG
ncbi:hypothetical protein KA005_60985 [bacterium]|nr:hypothetical protein [bacterium]